MTNKEAFEKMVELCNFYHHTIVKDTDITFVCDYRIDNIRKDLEVLEILKNKNEDIKGLIYAIRNEEELKDKYKYESSLDFYNKSVAIINETKLTQEEFDKLAEWVKRNNMI